MTLRIFLSLSLCSLIYSQVEYHFSYTGAMQTWTVPDGTTIVYSKLCGASGGPNVNSNTAPGGCVQGSIKVTPGEILYVNVGGKGFYRGEVDNDAGYNGGGWGYHSGGGGATDVRQYGTGLEHRVLVAGGGGGGGGFTSGSGGNGGAGGGLVGGGNPTTMGGTQTAGGIGYGADTTAGQFGIGGTSTTIGAGGGGGWYGGGGGGNILLSTIVLSKKNK
jgi:hypothetical protein